MKKSDILWTNDGWILLQEADAVKHVLEISCRAEDGQVVEIRKRHNDGEEEKFTARVTDELTLPVPLADFKKAFKAGKITLK